MNIHAAAAYAAHLLTSRSTAGHGVHSPLMFSFITEVIGGRADKHIMDEVRRLKREMLTDRRAVRVTDLGAGSTVLRGRERSIRQIASVAALPSREVALLARIAASLDIILERVPDYKAGGPQPNGWPAQGLEPTHRPEQDREPVVRPAQEQNPNGRPEQDREPVVRPAQEQNPTGRPEEDREPVIWPSHEQNPNGRPEQDREPVVRPAQEQKPTGRQANNPENTPPGEILQPDNLPVILELGTSLGISTLALALAAPDRRVITVEGCPELAAIARENLRRHGASNTEVLNMEFSQALIHLREKGTIIGMAFIDGNHRGAALTDYTHRIMEMGDQMVIVADDIHMNSDMTGAWKSLCEGLQTPRKADSTRAQSGLRQTGNLPGKQSQLASTAGATGKMALLSSPSAYSLDTASLETFRLGILFCLRNLTPGHYRIRY